MRAGNYVVDAPVYPHARRTHERMQSLQSRLATHPSYDHKGDGESLPTIEQQSFELARLVLKHYARFLGLPRRPLPPHAQPRLPAPPEGRDKLAIAAEAGELEKVDRLIEDGAEAEATDDAGRTALHVRPHPHPTSRSFCLYSRDRSGVFVVVWV